MDYRMSTKSGRRGTMNPDTIYLAWDPAVGYTRMNKAACRVCCFHHWHWHLVSATRSVGWCMDINVKGGADGKPYEIDNEFLSAPVATYQLFFYCYWYIHELQAGWQAIVNLEKVIHSLCFYLMSVGLREEDGSGQTCCFWFCAIAFWYRACPRRMAVASLIQAWAAIFRCKMRAITLVQASSTHFDIFQVVITPGKYRCFAWGLYEYGFQRPDDLIQQPFNVAGRTAAFRRTSGNDGYSPSLVNTSWEPVLPQCLGEESYSKR